MSATVSDFAASITGCVLQPTDPAFEEARRVHNGMIDRRPAIIVQSRGRLPSLVPAQGLVTRIDPAHLVPQRAHVEPSPTRAVYPFHSRRRPAGKTDAPDRLEPVG